MFMEIRNLLTSTLYIKRVQGKTRTEANGRQWSDKDAMSSPVILFVSKSNYLYMLLLGLRNFRRNQSRHDLFLCGEGFKGILPDFCN